MIVRVLQGIYYTPVIGIIHGAVLSQRRDKSSPYRRDLMRQEDLFQLLPHQLSFDEEVKGSRRLCSVKMLDAVNKRPGAAKGKPDEHSRARELQGVFAGLTESQEMVNDL